jgi:hypothetical protein
MPREEITPQLRELVVAEVSRTARAIAARIGGQAQHAADRRPPG